MFFFSLLAAPRAAFSLSVPSHHPRRQRRRSIMRLNELLGLQSAPLWKVTLGGCSRALVWVRDPLLIHSHTQQRYRMGYYIYILHAPGVSFPMHTGQTWFSLVMRERCTHVLRLRFTSLLPAYSFFLKLLMRERACQMRFRGNCLIAIHWHWCCVNFWELGSCNSI